MGQGRGGHIPITDVHGCFEVPCMEEENMADNKLTRKIVQKLGRSKPPLLQAAL